jgi:hypothetical protein
MTSKTIGSGFRVSAGKIVKLAARMPAGQAANAYKKVARDEKRLRANAAKARGTG